MKFLKPLLPTLAAVIFAVGVSHADFFYKWSQTAANNANSDTFTWAEGQAPSTVNDSARAMMASLAKFRDDTSGKLVTTGTATAYVVTSNQVFSTLALMDGAELAFRPNVTSGAAPTLNVDGLGAKALNQATTVAVATGALISGAVYRATYVNASNEWIVQGVAGAVPSGTTMLSMTACPTGWTTATTVNDRALVISSSTAGTTAGATAFSTYFNGSSVSGATTLSTAQIPAHSHPINTNTGAGTSHSHGLSTLAVVTNGPGGLNIAGGGGSYGNASGGTTDAEASHTHPINSNTDNSGSGGSHTHTIPAVQSVTVIGCTKN